MTVVVSTHQMDEVVHCDRVALIRAGSVLSDSTPQELFAGGGATVTIDTTNNTVEHHVDSLETDLPRILHGMGLDPAVRRIDIEGPTLEDLILGLIEDEGEAPR